MPSSSNPPSGLSGGRHTLVGDSSASDPDRAASRDTRQFGCAAGVCVCAYIHTLFLKKIKITVFLICFTSAHHLLPVFTVCWLVSRAGLLPVPDPSWPGHFYQHRCNSGSRGSTETPPGLPLWLQGFAPRPTGPRESLSWGERLCSAVCHDPGACHLFGCTA